MMSSKKSYEPEEIPADSGPVAISRFKKDKPEPFARDDRPTALDRDQNHGPEIFSSDDGPNPTVSELSDEKLKHRSKKKKSKNQKPSTSSSTSPKSTDEERTMQNAVQSRMFPGAVAIDGEPLQQRSSSAFASPPTRPQESDEENPSQRNEDRSMHTGEVLVEAECVTDGGSQHTSDPSTSIVYGVPMTKRNKWFILITILLAVLVGAIVTIAVVLTRQGNSSVESDSVQAPMTPSPPSTSLPPTRVQLTPAPGGEVRSPTLSPVTMPPAPFMPTAVFANSIQLRDSALTEAGGYTIEVSSDAVSTESECLVFCADYIAVRWASSVSGDKCVCYSLITDVTEPCATPWGSSVDSASYVAFGTIYSKQPFSTCSADFCTVQPNDGLCFTANTLSLRDYTLTEAGGYDVALSSETVSTEVECRDFCAEYDATRWAYSATTKCVCFSLIAEAAAQCATPWGNGVAASSYISSGTIFFKQSFAVCSSDYCTAQPNDALCFTANTLSLRDYTLTEAGGYAVNTTGSLVTTEAGCRDFCAEYDAMRWASSTSGDKCVCYSLVGDVANPCTTPWGSQVDTSSYIASGTIFSKKPFATCSVDYCTSLPNDPVCFTANTLSLRDYTLTEAGGYEVAATGDLVTTESGCREFCAEYDAVRWASSTTGDKCVCYSLIAGVSGPCGTPWGSQVDASYIATGTIFSKQPFATCSVDYCTVQPNDALCFTANTLSLRDYTLTETGGYAVNKTGDLMTTEADCRIFCAEYDAVRWSSYTTDDKCICYSLIADVTDPCATPWGSQVGTSGYIASGTIFSKQPFATCSADFCTVQPNEALCFTANTLSLRDNALTEAGGYEIAIRSDLITTEAGCREFCAEYDAVKWASYASSDKCVCYSLISDVTSPCATPWGSQVSTSYVESGSIFSKQPFNTCSVDFCETDDNNYLCFTATQASSSAFVVAAAAEQVTASSLTECFQACQSFGVAEYNSYTDVCQCFDTPDCLAVAADGQSISFRSIYTKEAIVDCSESLCDLVPENELCSTAT